MRGLTSGIDIAAPIPKIVLGETDHRRLTALATATLKRQPDIAEALLTELDRASVVGTETLPPNVVGMNSWVEFAADGGSARLVRLVFPGEANIDEGRISILTPIGAALIGLSPGQSFQWVGPNGHPHRLTVIAVRPASLGDVAPLLTLSAACRQQLAVR